MPDDNKTVFQQIRDEHKAQPVPPDSSLKETFERTTQDIAQAMTLLNEKTKRTDAEVARIKAEAKAEFQRNNEEIQTKVDGQLEQREKELQEKLAEFQRSKSIEDEKTQKVQFRRDFQDFIKKGNVPEHAKKIEDFTRNTQVSNPTNAGFAVTPVQLLGVHEQLKAISNLHELVNRMEMNTRAGVLAVKKARKVDADSVPFLVEGQTATKQHVLNMSETQFQTQAMSLTIILSQQFLEMAINPEQMISRDIEQEMTEALNKRILYGDTDGTIGPGGIYPEMEVNAGPGKFKAYNSTTANTIALQDLQKFYSEKDIWAYRGKCKWYLSTDALAKLRFQTGSDNHFTWSQDIREGFAQLLNGDPIIPVVEMPNVATGNIPVLYGDMQSAYVIVEFASSYMIRDEYTLAADRAVRFVYYRYLDGKTVDERAVVGLRVA